jgi:nitrile hydratase accessory protein
MPTGPNLSALRSLPHDAEGPVFREPWEAQAFALAVQLQERGLFTWDEWAQALGAEIASAQKAGDADLGETYYRHWLSALERLVVSKGAASQAGLEQTKEAWDRAAKATPHGQPIVLPP